MTPEERVAKLAKRVEDYVTGSPTLTYKGIDGMIVEVIKEHTKDLERQVEAWRPVIAAAKKSRGHKEWPYVDLSYLTDALNTLEKHESIEESVIIKQGEDGHAECAKCGERDYPLVNHKCKAQCPKCGIVGRGDRCLSCNAVMKSDSRKPCIAGDDPCSLGPDHAGECVPHDPSETRPDASGHMMNCQCGDVIHCGVCGRRAQGRR